MTTSDLDVEPTEEEFTDIFHFQQWLAVLASPHIHSTMRRMPTQQDLCRLLDAYLPYAGSRRRLTNRTDDWRPDPQKRETCALELRAAIERWNSPAFSREITDAARALLREDGVKDPEGGWDAFTVNLKGPPEEYLFWPEASTRI